MPLKDQRFLSSSGEDCAPRGLWALLGTSASSHRYLQGGLRIPRLLPSHAHVQTCSAHTTVNYSRHLNTQAASSWSFGQEFPLPSSPCKQQQIPHLLFKSPLISAHRELRNDTSRYKGKKKPTLAAFSHRLSQSAKRAAKSKGSTQTLIFSARSFARIPSGQR